jgi:phytoene synthase
MDAYEHAAGIVRQRDPDRFIADLFAPEPARKHLFALHAFDAEIARIRFVVTEPALGEIRLQWWRDAIVNNEGGGNPLAEALLETIATFGLPRAAFEALLTAHIFDLYNDPMPTMADFEGYAGETASAMVQLASLVLAGGKDAGSADASGHAGVALALRDAMRRFGADAKRRRLFLPRDVFAAHGVSIDAIFALHSTPEELQHALADLRRAARDHLAKAITALRPLPKAIVPAFLPLALVGPDLDRLERARAFPFDAPTLLPRWRRQLRLRRAARRGLG